jgi:uncharacterized membrane protein
MKKYRLIIAGIGFLVVSVIILGFYRPEPPLLTIGQANGTRFPYLYEGFVKGFVHSQELIMKKDYLNGIELRVATKGRQNTSTNTLLLLDSNLNLLYQQKFSSADAEDSKYIKIRFKSGVHAGKGNKVVLCFFSADGDTSNCLHGLFNNQTKLGALCASVIVNGDVIGSIKNKIRLYPGSMILRTYESDSDWTALLKKGWFLLIFLITALIIFFGRITSFVVRLRLRPEVLFAITALVAGSVYAVITPPFQVPDEGTHFRRTFEVAGFRTEDPPTVPSSVVRIDSILSRLHFNREERTSKAEILALMDVPMEPGIRQPGLGPDYIAPYMPQVFGLWVGQIFTSSPLLLMYFSRFFNLIFAIVVLFFAIRIMPAGKWVLFLLALMPKTIFLLASVSYDAYVISLSFLLIALFLHFAFRPGKMLVWRDLGLLFLLTVLLALAKPPYFIAGFLFLIIPVAKVGSWKKYLLVFSVFVISMLMAQGTFSLLGKLVNPPDAQGVMKSKEHPVPQFAGLSLFASADQPQGPKQGATADSSRKVNPAPQGTPKSPFDPQGQVKYIRSHVWDFLKLLAVTNAVDMRENILNNFVGTMGWLDTFMPDRLVNFYLVILLVVALCLTDQDLHPGWRRKTWFFILFAAGCLAIETAMYIFSSYVGGEIIYGIQGRYFIPIAPLFLFLFYNTFISRKLNFLISPSRTSYHKAKPAQKSKILQAIEEEQFFSRYLQVFITGFAIIVLLRGMAAILFRYYIW